MEQSEDKKIKINKFDSKKSVDNNTVSSNMAQAANEEKLLNTINNSKTEAKSNDVKSNNNNVKNFKANDATNADKTITSDSSVELATTPHQNTEFTTKIHVFERDIPENFFKTNCLSFDTEAMGLKVKRDRLCVIQICEHIEEKKLNNVAVVKIFKDQTSAPNIQKIFEDPSIAKIAHFARFDVRIMFEYLNINTKNINCTHIMSSLARTYTNNHSLKDVCRDILGILLNKQAGASDWGSRSLTDEQLKYAVGDVLYLKKIFQGLNEILSREDRLCLYNIVREGIIIYANLDVAGWGDIFMHHCERGRHQ